LFLWAFFAASVITLLPIWESRRSFVAFARYIFKGELAGGPAKNREVIEGLSNESETRSEPDEKRAMDKAQAA
jgi:hypothetical protein